MSPQYLPVEVAILHQKSEPAIVSSSDGHIGFAKQAPVDLDVLVSDADAAHRLVWKGSPVTSHCIRRSVSTVSVVFVLK